MFLQQNLDLFSGIQGMLLLILLMVVLVLAAYWNAQYSPKAVAHEASSHPEAETHPTPAEADDLTKIEGVGPKIAEILKAGGIQTFSQLAQVEVDQIQVLLDQAGSRYRLAEPDSWPTQANLAAQGDWQALEALQDQLKGGR